MDSNNKKERPLYLPPSMRDRNNQPASSTEAPNQRLEVKLDIKKDKIIHAWEKEEKVVHAWERVNQDKKREAQDKPRNKSHKFQSKASKKDHSTSRTSTRDKFTSANQSDRHNAKPKSAIVQSVHDLPDKPQKQDKVFIDAQQYLAEIATSDWNDPGDIDYSKVPKFNH